MAENDNALPPAAPQNLEQAMQNLMVLIGSTQGSMAVRLSDTMGVNLCHVIAYEVIEFIDEPAAVDTKGTETAPAKTHHGPAIRRVGDDEWVELTPEQDKTFRAHWTLLADLTAGRNRILRRLFPAEAPSAEHE